MNVGCFGDPSVHVDLLSVVYKSVNIIPSSVQSVVWNVFIFHHSMHISVSADTQTFRLPSGSTLQTDTVFGPAYFKRIIILLNIGKTTQQIAQLNYFYLNRQPQSV